MFQTVKGLYIYLAYWTCASKTFSCVSIERTVVDIFLFGWNEMCVESLIWCVCSRPTTWICMAVSTSGSSQDGTRGTGGNRRTPQTAQLRSFWQPWRATSAWILSLSVPNRLKEYQEEWVSAMRWDLRSYEWDFWFLTEKISTMWNRKKWCIAISTTEFQFQ